MEKAYLFKFLQCKYFQLINFKYQILIYNFMSWAYPLALVPSVILLFTNCLSALQVSPLRTIAQIEAGQKTEGSITLINNKDFPVSIEVESKDLVQNENNDAEWFTLSQDAIFLEPNSDTSLDYKVLLPEGSTGEYKARVAFLERPLNSEGEALVSINTKISIPLFFSVKGTEVYDFEVVDFKLDKNSRSEAEMVIINRGNVHVRPIGTCLIKCLNENSVIKSLAVNSDGYPIFPGLEQQFKVKLGASLPTGKYAAELEFKLSNTSEHSIRKSFEFEISKKL